MPQQFENNAAHDDGVFVHECENDGCLVQVQFDDEPFCFAHSPDEGSSVRGYSARAKGISKKYRRIEILVDIEGMNDVQFELLRRRLEHRTWESLKSLNYKAGRVQANEVDFPHG